MITNKQIIPWVLAFLVTTLFFMFVMPMISAYDTQKQYDNYNLVISSNNATNCNLTYIIISGNLTNYNLEMTKNFQDFSILINGNNFTELKDICMGITCWDSSSNSEPGSKCLTITPSGQANINSGQGLTLFGSLIVIIICGIAFFILFIKAENLGFKTVWGSLAVTDMIIAILFSMVLITQVVGGYDSLVTGFSTFLFVFKILFGIGLISFILFAFYLSFMLWKFKRGHIS